MSDAKFEIMRDGKNSLCIKVAGALDAQNMEVALQRLSIEMEGMHHGDLLMIDQGAEMPTLGAIGVELRHWPQLMAMLHQLDRTALVTHNALFRNLASVESAMIPGFEIRSFYDERSARAWLKEERTAPA